MQRNPEIPITVFINVPTINVRKRTEKIQHQVSFFRNECCVHISYSNHRVETKQTRVTLASCFHRVSKRFSLFMAIVPNHQLIMTWRGRSRTTFKLDYSHHRSLPV